MADTRDDMLAAAKIQPRHRNDEQTRLAAKGVKDGVDGVKNADFQARREQSAGL